MESGICPFLQRYENLIHQSSVGPPCKRMLLRFAHFRGSHHLHGLGDLRGVADRSDSAPYVLRVRHLNVWLDYRQAVLNSSRVAFNCASRSLSSSLFWRIAPSN